MSFLSDGRQRCDMRAPCGEPGRIEKGLEERPCLFKP